MKRLYPKAAALLTLTASVVVTILMYRQVTASNSFLPLPEAVDFINLQQLARGRLLMSSSPL